MILYNAGSRRIHLGSLVQAAEKEVSREVKSDKELQTGFAKKGAFQRIHAWMVIVCIMRCITEVKQEQGNGQSYQICIKRLYRVNQSKYNLQGLKF